MQTLVDAVARHAAEQPSKLAVAFKDDQLSYAELWEQALCAAAELAEQGVGVGDRVALVCAPRPQTIAAYLGIHVLGATAVLVDKAASAEALAQVCDVAQTAIVLTEGAVPENLRKLSPRALCASGGHVEPVPVEGESAWDIIFTTGTTGEPKGATLSARAVAAITKNNVAGVGLRASDVTLVPLPLHHSVALRVSRSVLEIGATLVLQNGFTFAREVERNIDRFGCTTMVAVPTSMETVRSQMQGRFGEIVGRLRAIEIGAGALPTAQRMSLAAELPNTTLISTYGSSETGGTIFLNVGEAVRSGKGLEAAGKPVAGVELRLAGERADGSGRLSLRGPMVMSGYWARADLNDEAFDDGWLLSGDMARIDDDGFVYLLGRADDIIIMGGENVSPVEIENAASLCDGVAECACIGAEDPEGLLGQIPVLYVVPDGSGFSEAQLRAQLSERVGSRKAPRAYVVLDELPRNDMKKVRKGYLRELWEEAGTSLSLGPVLQGIFSRRSVRSFVDKPVPRPLVDLVVKAGFHAPTGHNMQSWRFTVLEDAATVARLRDAAEQAARGSKVHFYGFENPAFVVIVSNNKRNPDGCQDASAAAENMFLAAQGLGLGGTWVNALMTLRDVEPAKSLLDELGVPANHVVWCTACFGYPVAPGAKMARKTDVVRYVNRA